jgi:ribonuclease BN (tRNA processing enzyme)
VQLTIIGCSSASGNPGEAQSGYLLDVPEGRILLDCGAGIAERIRAADTAPGAIVVSDLHPDHFIDVLPMAFAILDGSLAWRPTVWLPPGGRVVLDDILRALGWRLHILERAMPIREYRTAAPLELFGVSLRFARARHSAHSYLLRAAAAGRTLVYTGDTAPDPAIREHAEGADLFLCEATLLEVGDDGSPERVHLTVAEAATIARDAGVGRLVLTHTRAPLRRASVDVARAIFPQTAAAQPGAVFAV